MSYWRLGDKVFLGNTILMTAHSLLGSHKIMAFVGVRDPGRAKKFYGDKLGLHLVSEDPFALVFDAQGTMLRVSIVPAVAQAKYTGWGCQVQVVSAPAKDSKRA